MAALRLLSLCGMMGEKKHCRKDPNIAETIGTWQIDPQTCNIAERQIDLFFCLVESIGIYIYIYLRVYMYIDIYIYIYIYIWRSSVHLCYIFLSSVDPSRRYLLGFIFRCFFPGSAAGGGSPLIRRCRPVVVAKHSFSYPGARRCRRPSLKSFSLLGFSRFWGFGVGEKRVKFADAFWRSLLGVFWSVFGQFFIIFWYCPRVKIV